MVFVQRSLGAHKECRWVKDKIGVPVLTVHTTRDPGIPFSHEELFAATVGAAGRSDLLVQRPIDRWGHCAITPGEIQAAFADLVEWVTTGQRP